MDRLGPDARPPGPRGSVLPRRARDPETGQTLISGMGELHLEIITDRLLREFGVQANVGRPQVAYKETITEPVRVEGRYIKQTGGSGDYGVVVLEVAPGAPGSGFKFEKAIKGAPIPTEFVPAVRHGCEEASQSGELGGYPVVDISVRLVDGQAHDVDSSERSFKIAGSMAMREALRKAKPVLLEPIMNVEVVTPDDFVGAVQGDLNSRRGQLTGIEMRGERARDPGARPARHDVRVREQPALDDAGSRHLHHAVLALRPGARRGRPQARELLPSGREVDGQGEVRADEAARERGDDRSRGPRQDDVDGGDHAASGEEGPGGVRAVRPDRQGAGGAGARDHDRDGARGVPDGEASLRARGLPGSRGLREEHDHGRGADGRGDPGGVGGGRPDAADARARAAGAAGERSAHRGVPEQVRHGGRPGAARSWWSWRCGSC